MTVENEARRVDIETKLAYLEDTVLTLNEVLARQQKQIDQLESKIRQVVERVQQMSALAEAAAPAADEKPPHY
ncbi:MULTISPECIES: SlyX family protein [Methylococcus]|uniref:Protein SlyX homolog n=1 Tax=Methylococcus capsulatus TaxID=414 RepID=A0ABZ2F6F6_METCP|nr:MULTISPECIES: SlyX family protein [Methylococcus]MDF9392448.1 SlyX family protein [Methylococcus capsulatus]